MKHSLMLVMVCTVLFVPVFSAKASTIDPTGTVNTSGGAPFNAPPSTFVATGNTFDLNMGSVPTAGAITNPAATGEIATILDMGTDLVTDINFGSAGIMAAGSTGEEILSISVLGGDTLSFWATGWSNVVDSSSSTEGAVMLTGYVTNSQSSLYTSPFMPAVLDFDANGLNNNFTEDLTVSPSATPEPSSLMLLGSGLLGLVGIGRRRFAA